MAEYRTRLIDSEIAAELDAFGAVLIVGPKWCGKTTSATRLARSIINFHDPDKRQRYLAIAGLRVSELLKGERPRLIDEWQDIPAVWDAVRIDIDASGESSQFLLTGSRRPIGEKPLHSGTGRIAMVRMNTFSLFESGHSNGSVSLSGLFDNAGGIVASSELTLDDYARLIVRGGWPQSLGKSDDVCRRHIRGYCENLVSPMASGCMDKYRDPQKMEKLLRSLSRNIAAPLSKKTLLQDICGGDDGVGISPNTLNEYLSSLRDIYVLDELPAWNPNLRFKTAIRTTEVIHLCDPAVGAYFLSASAEGLLGDPHTFGLLFESLVVRDLRVYASSMDAKVYHYRDKSGLEADAIFHLHDGRWGAMEVKLSTVRVDEAARNLLKLRDRILEASGKPPSFLAVITAEEYAYTRTDGIHVIPLGCLRN